MVFGDPVVEHSLDSTRRFQIDFCYGECSMEEIAEHLSGLKDHSGRCGLSTYSQESKRQWGISFLERTYKYNSQQEWTYSLANTPKRMRQLLAHTSRQRVELGVRLKPCDNFFDELKITGTAAVVLGIGAIVVTSKGIFAPKIKGILWPLVKLNPIPVHAHDAAQNSVCHWFNSMLPVGMDMVLGYTSDTYNDQNAWYVRLAMPDSPTANTGRAFQMIFREVEHVRSKKARLRVCSTLLTMNLSALSLNLLYVKVSYQNICEYIIGFLVLHLRTCTMQS
ncbi:hypothetical protein GEMRC1_000989 [Eukaryota sp. GEM-RC1]